MFTQEELGRIWETLQVRFLERDAVEAEERDAADVWLAEDLSGTSADRRFYRLYPISIHPQTIRDAVPMHRHNYIEMVYMLQGRSEHTVNGVPLTLSPGDLLFIGEHTAHTVAEMTVDDYLINFVIRPRVLDRVVEMMDPDNRLLYDFFLHCLRRDSDEPAYLYFAVAGSRPVRNLVENLLFSLMEPRYDQTLLQTVLGLLMMYLQNETVNLRFTRQEDDVIWRVMEYIDTDYAVANLHDFSKTLPMSYHSLSRMIVQKTGKTFKMLLREKRLIRASELLRKTEMSVQDVAGAVGYSNMTYFYEIFTEFTGMKPMDYRRAEKRKEAERIPQ